jgi:hypothetical protein
MHSRRLDDQAARSWATESARLAQAVDAVRADARGVTDAPAAARRRSPGLLLLYAFCAYSALSVLVTFPLVLHLGTRLPKDLGDPLLTTSILWWNAQVTPLTDRWWDGFGFFPAPGMMAFSSNFLGASLIASPLQWLGASPVTAYNLTFLVSFPLCAVAAHALTFTLTRRHDAGVVCGLAYGFNPFRVAHVEHLELLMAYGMPAALAALHQYANTRRARWLALLVASLVVQALSASYYALFFTVFFGLWLLWFMRPRDWRATVATVAAAGVSALIVSPVAFATSRVWESYNWRRDLYEEVLRFSADLSSFATASPLSAFWGWTAAWNGGERQLFPGLTVTVLGITGIVLLRRHRVASRDRLTVLSRVCWGISAAFLSVAIAAFLGAHWSFTWHWLTVSVTVAYKPLSLAAAFAIFAIALSQTMRAAARQRSALAFYIVASVVCLVCSLGPEPTALGARFLYEPPYAWLMRLPWFDDTVRVPARFGMLAMLALAVAGSLAFDRFAPPGRRRVALMWLIIGGILGDGWMRALPLPAVPPRGFQLLPGDRAAAVMELPLGDVWRDTAAMYRATLHGTRVVNGYNGFEPIYYQALRRALADRDTTVLDALAAQGPLVIAAASNTQADRPWASFLSNHPDVRPLRQEDDWMLFRLPLKRGRPYEECRTNPLAIAAVFDGRGPVDLATVTDENPNTRWITSGPQRAGDLVTLDLGGSARVCRVVLSMGSAAVLYPGALSVLTSVDGVSWEPGFSGHLGGAALRAALKNPRDARISVPLNGRTARFITLRIEQSQPLYPWAVADVLADGSP